MGRHLPPNAAPQQYISGYTAQGRPMLARSRQCGGNRGGKLKGNHGDEARTHWGQSQTPIPLRRAIQPAAVATARLSEYEPQANQAVRTFSSWCATLSQASCNPSRSPTLNVSTPIWLPCIGIVFVRSRPCVGDRYGDRIACRSGAATGGRLYTENFSVRLAAPLNQPVNTVADC
jgi:hypothetical protein